jgi:hypothetical protein
MSVGQELSSIDFQSMIGGPLNASSKLKHNLHRHRLILLKVLGSMRQMQKQILGNQRWSLSNMIKSFRRKTKMGILFTRRNRCN